MNDRSYYRTLPIKVLIEAARDSGHELAIVLGEHLEELEAEGNAYVAALNADLESLQIDCGQLEDKVYELRAEIETLELMISERDRIIDELNRSK